MQAIWSAHGDHYIKNLAEHRIADGARIMYDINEVFAGLDNLAAHVQELYPRAEVRIMHMGRIGALFDIIMNDQLVVVEFAYKDGFGVTEVTDDMDFTRYWEEQFLDLADVRPYLEKVLAKLSERSSH